MSKKDRNESLEPQVMEETSEAVETEAEKLEAFKAKKREAAERFKERKAKEKAEKIEKAKALIDNMKNAGIYDSLSDADKAFLNSLANPSAASAGSGTSSLFSQLFPTGEIGASITLKEAFNKTLKGKSAIDHYIKKWSEKGIVVSFKKNDTDILESVYVLEDMLTAK